VHDYILLTKPAIPYSMLFAAQEVGAETVDLSHLMGHAIRYSDKMQRLSSSRSQVRALLMTVLRTDADFDAFCLDCYPHVKARFSAAMDRQQRITLLLELEPQLDCIVEQLRQTTPSDPIWQTKRMRSPRWQVLVLALAMVLLGVLLGAGGRRQSQRTVGDAASQVGSAATSPPAASAAPPLPPPAPEKPLAPPPGVNSDNRIENSPHATMKNRALKSSLPQRVNSGNVINASPGAQMINEVR
jgi:hypothetical protein